LIKKLRICGFDFDVVYKESVIENGNSCLGCCKSDANIIEMKGGITPQRENEVILHESIHAISDIMNLDLNENSVNTLGVMLINFIAQNKKFILKTVEEN
jgi:hypothetical protein